MYIYIYIYTHIQYIISMTTVYNMIYCSMSGFKGPSPQAAWRRRRRRSRPRARARAGTARRTQTFFLT